jgi:hypothetical protein
MDTSKSRENRNHYANQRQLVGLFGRGSAPESRHGRHHFQCGDIIQDSISLSSCFSSFEVVFYVNLVSGFR